MPDLAALRWATQQEAVNIGRLPLEPEQWAGGRMAFEYERHLAHEHEGLRDRLSDFVAATARNVLGDLYQQARVVADTRDSLRVADRDLAVTLDSWNRLYREVHEDELELGRYFRLKSKPHQLVKWLIALAVFGAEVAMSLALFDRVIEGTNPAMPYLFALGLILILVVVPHYSVIGIKEGVTRYHQAELDGYVTANVQVPSKLRKKARLEEVEDYGAKLVAGIVGLVLVLLFIPLSSLRATELGTSDQRTLWFWFFLLLQFGVSGYFFLREWVDYGTASANLKHHDLAKRDASRVRDNAYASYTDAVSEFMTRSQDLLFLYRQAPRWDSYIVESYLGTIHYLRHAVTLNHPELDVFIAHSTVPYLGTDTNQPPQGTPGEFYPVAQEHVELMGNDDLFSRGWWMKQANVALIDTVRDHGVDRHSDEEGQIEESQTPLSFESPERLLAEFLDRYFDLQLPYRRPVNLDDIEEVDDDIEPHDDSSFGPSSPEAEEDEVESPAEELAPGVVKREALSVPRPADWHEHHPHPWATTRPPRDRPPGLQHCALPRAGGRLHCRVDRASDGTPSRSTLTASSHGSPQAMRARQALPTRGALGEPSIRHVDLAARVGGWRTGRRGPSRSMRYPGVVHVDGTTRVQTTSDNPHAIPRTTCRP